jgi:hypothetical protein
VAGRIATARSISRSFCVCCNRTERAAATGAPDRDGKNTGASAAELEPEAVVRGSETACCSGLVVDRAVVGRREEAEAAADIERCKAGAEAEADKVLGWRLTGAADCFFFPALCCIASFCSKWGLADGRVRRAEGDSSGAALTGAVVVSGGADV